MIEDKAKELGRLIGQSPEYKAVRRANEALGQDLSAVTILKQMEELRINAQRMIQRGERPSEEMERELDTLLSQVQQMPVYQRLVAAQENFDKIMAKVNDWIVDGIEKGATSSIITLGDAVTRPAPGRVIVFEGGEGSGKSTQLRRLAMLFERRDIPHVSLREPGGTQLGTEVRRVLLDRASDIEPRAEALLFMASRAQLVEREIRPALADGRVVLLDRFFLSTYAYQVGGHGLPEREVRNANTFATGGLVPDLTILLTFPVAEGLARAARRDTAQDRMEAMGDTFHERVAAALISFSHPEWQAAHPECGPIVAVDARGAEDQVCARVTAVLASRFPDLVPIESDEWSEADAK